MDPDARCPCGSGLTYGECCGPLHNGATSAPTAERLMRSRFSAFAMGDPAYLLRSWHPDARPASIEIDPDTRWLWLEIVRTERGSERDSDGVVEFRAKYRVDAPEGRSSGVQHEVSTFARVAGEWVYVDGEA
ncbi:SEC-C domain-containing protein [Agreia pratensis]|uniref:YchJ family protein n=1 Tax=Agreia pratensis TaxID=150121 RepID=UPI00188BFBD0|nr:YchJ family metal-binding protein [Agreia pratensis]MBF4636030.1 SEC-C domain-containing protein [Agreia pratensis]